MKRIVILSFFLVPLVFPSFAQKDINAWKSADNLEQQYSVFKDNVNFWDGKYFMTGAQLDEFYNALNDSVAALEEEISEKAARIDALQSELNATNDELENTKAELDTSIKNRNAISVLGMNIDKSAYTLIVSMIILALLVALGIVFLLYKRSNNVTVKTRKEYEGLKEEFEIHKKNALDRYTKINTELHHTRMKLKNQ